MVARGLERWKRGRARRGSCAARDRYRRGRVDPHPRSVLRPRRAEADGRTHRPRPPTVVDRPVDQGSARDERRRRRAAARDHAWAGTGRPDRRAGVVTSSRPRARSHRGHVPHVRLRSAPGAGRRALRRGGRRPAGGHGHHGRAGAAAVHRADRRRLVHDRGGRGAHVDRSRRGHRTCRRPDALPAVRTRRRSGDQHRCLPRRQAPALRPGTRARRVARRRRRAGVPDDVHRGLPRRRARPGQRRRRLALVGLQHPGHEHHWASVALRAGRGLAQRGSVRSADHRPAVRRRHGARGRRRLGSRASLAAVAPGFRPFGE